MEPRVRAICLSQIQDKPASRTARVKTVRTATAGLIKMRAFRRIYADRQSSFQNSDMLARGLYVEVRYDAKLTALAFSGERKKKKKKKRRLLVTRDVTAFVSISANGNAN